MSTNVICDICGKPLQAGTETSAYIFLEHKLNFSSTAGKPAMVQVQEDYCTFCSDKVKSAVADIKKASSLPTGKEEKASEKKHIT